jgi:hypothetical protein
MAVCPGPLAARAAAEVGRLAGHLVSEHCGQYEIEDIAGEGRPIVGVVERRGVGLWVQDLQLTGPLARPRIAGPGYKVWVLGDRDGRTLRARRLGVLAPPAPVTAGQTPRECPPPQSPQ